MKLKNVPLQWLLTLVALLLLVQACKKNEIREKEPDAEKQRDIAVIDSRIEQWMSQNNMPGFSLAISKNGKLVYSKGYGFAGQTPAIPVTTGSQFRIASVSKLITAAAVMKLVQDGKVKMDDRVFGISSILGTMYGTQPYKTYVTDVTVSDLLHHTSGGWGQDNDPAFFDITLDAAAIISYTLNNLPLTRKPASHIVTLAIWCWKKLSKGPVVRLTRNM
jgi:CubicO group peptidase (beta-lactamase class C family)